MALGSWGAVKRDKILQPSFILILIDGPFLSSLSSFSIFYNKHIRINHTVVVKNKMNIAFAFNYR